jgi:hypothetical protein
MWRCALIAALITPVAAQAQTLDAARAFTRTLYAAYRAGDPDYLGRDAGRTFAPQLLALIRRDAASTPEGEVGVLDGDPICDCQDPGGLRLDRLAIRPAGSGRARAEVTLRFAGETRRMRLSLLAIHGQWRVADVNTRETPSLVRLLEAGLH